MAESCECRAVSLKFFPCLVFSENKPQLGDILIKLTLLLKILFFSLQLISKYNETVVESMLTESMGDYLDGYKGSFNSGKVNQHQN